MPDFISGPVLNPQDIPLLGSITYGVTSGVIGAHAHTGALSLVLSLPPDGTTAFVAEADRLTGQAQAGHNTLTGTVNEAIGDAVTLSGHAQGGGNSIMISGALGPGIAIGDAYTLTGHAHGGDNTVSSLARGGQAAVGDAVFMSGFAEGGHNHVSGSARIQTFLYGDAEFMSQHATGGYNTLTGVETNPTVMFGDAFELSGHATGGHNTLIAPSGLGPVGPSYNLMYGDGYELLDHASGGGNTLVSGGSNDMMYGDAAIVSPQATTAPNSFVFTPHNANDQIMDFRQGSDHIELRGFGFSSFSQLAADISSTAHGELITFGANDTILVVGVNQLRADDFVFT